MQLDAVKLAARRERIYGKSFVLTWRKHDDREPFKRDTRIAIGDPTDLPSFKDDDQFVAVRDPTTFRTIQDEDRREGEIMAEPLIAIVGSSDPKRQNELSLRNVVIAKQAGEDLGRELAKKGCHIVVYASDEHLLEVDVVRGYLRMKDAGPKRIQVRFSQKNGRPAFVEEQGNEDYFVPVPDSRSDWEISFYRSLSEVDGVILLGGGSSTLIAGLIAMGYRKPILACAGFGGSASKVWEVLSVQKYPILTGEMYRMAEERWSPKLAEEYVEILLAQKDRFASEAEEQRRAEEERRKEHLRAEEERLQAHYRAEEERLRAEHAESTNVTLHALASVLLFVVALAPWPIAWGSPNLGYLWLICLLLASPVLAGASGSTIRVVMDWAQGTKPTAAQSVIKNGALGFVAGGITGILFILSQLVANPPGSGTEAQAQQASRLVPFAMSIRVHLDLWYPVPPMMRKPQPWARYGSPISRLARQNCGI